MNCCLRCAWKGKRAGCLQCCALAPKPKFQIVQDIIERHAHVHRLAQIADEKQIFPEIDGAIHNARCARRKKREGASNG